MMRRWISNGVLVASLVVVAGCATTAQPDPLEPMNRKVFAFNEAVDGAVLKPVATSYRKHVPEPLRMVATSFFGNLLDAWSAVNLFLQGRFGDGLRETMRFATNSTFGVLGLADVATPMGMERFGEDFGQTLGKWGVGPGAYLVLPILGPSSGRDVIGLPVELMASPSNLASSTGAQITLSGLNIVNRRASLLGATALLDDVALDKYSFVRDGYLQRRRNLVYDGNPPELPEEQDAPEEPPESEAAPVKPGAVKKTP
jgi:phospholipid-binding lipoprotein MlaA